MTAHAAIYARVSSEDQAREEKDSLGHQERSCRKYCEAMGYVLEDEHVFIDVWTGKVDERPEFDRMMAAVKACAVEVVVAHQVDRLGRDNTDLAVLLKHRLRPSGCEVAVVTAGINTQTTEGRLMYGLMSAFAEYDRDKIIERTTRGKKHACQREATEEKGNGWGGQEPYGYTWEGGGTGNLVVDAAESKTVLAAFEFRASGETLEQIADRLNAGGYAKTKTGRQWKSHLVGAVLRNRDLYEGKRMSMQGSTATLSAPRILA